MQGDRWNDIEYLEYEGASLEFPHNQERIR